MVLRNRNAPVDVEIPRGLSWSSVSSYTECGYRWLLDRRLATPSIEWLNTLGGSTLHEVTELADRKALGEDVQVPTFEEHLVKLIAESTPGARIRVSGAKRTKLQFTGGPNKQDLEWWLTYGPQMVAQWADFQRESGWKIATMPDGSRGIELKFEIEIEGIPVRGCIDRVMLTPSNEIVIVDIKGGRTSANMQLGTYGLAVEEAYGLPAEWATFWQPRLEDEAYPIGKYWREHMPSYPWGQLKGMYSGVDSSIRRGIFLPNVGSNCSGCTYALALPIPKPLPGTPEPVLPTLSRPHGTCSAGWGTAKPAPGRCALGRPTRRQLRGTSVNDWSTAPTWHGIRKPSGGYWPAWLPPGTSGPDRSTRQAPSGTCGPA